MPLANEFQLKMQQQAREAEAKIQTPSDTPQEHPEDILIVKNILVGYDHVVEEPIPYASAVPETNVATGQEHPFNRIAVNVFEHSWNTKDFFEVRWDGRPHRIMPGQQRRMPRYLADHFAKHLIDFMLRKEELEYEQKYKKAIQFVNNYRKRVELYDQIVVSVDEYYNGSLYGFQLDGQKVEAQVERLNPSSEAYDAGEVPHTAIGFTEDKVPEPTDLPTVEASPQDIPRDREEAIAGKTKSQLLAEARQLGLQVQPTMNKEQLYDAITHFAGL